MSSPMPSFIARALAERRSLEQAIADLRAKNARERRPDVAAMIRHGEAEMRDRTRHSDVAAFPASVAAC